MEAKKPVLAVQMYTLRDLAQNDMIGALRSVKEIGYDGIELAGFGNASPQEVKDAVDELDLQIVSAHAGFDALQNDPESVIEESRIMGNQFVVCSSLPQEKRGSAAGYIETGQVLNVAGARLREAGLQLCYHNHNFEFDDKFDEGYGFDLIYENSEPRNLQAEIDTYWVQKGGENPAQYIRKYAGRAPLIHIKDMSQDGDFTEIGNGTLDWPAIFSASRSGGAVAYIVEQDTCPGDPLDSLRLSFENFQKMDV